MDDRKQKLKKTGPKLSQDDRDWIVWQYNEGKATKKQLAEYFDITQGSVSYLILRRRRMLENRS